MQVYGAASTDGGATWRDEKLIYQSPDGHICPCCQPMASFDPRGGLHVMWRNDLAGARDMYLTSSKDGGHTFSQAVKLGHGTWILKQCPMDGGGLSANASGQVMTVWMRDRELFRCQPGEAEVSLGPGQQGWVVAGPGGFYLTWVVARPGKLMALVPGSAGPTVLAENAWEPVVAAPPAGKGPVIAAWEQGRPGSMHIYAAVLKPGSR
jgi:hypothetical protein